MRCVLASAGEGGKYRIERAETQGMTGGGYLPGGEFVQLQCVQTGETGLVCG
jgi:hypothetical protein